MKADSFVRMLDKLKGKSILLVEPPGNSGDTLLQKGLELYLRHSGHTLVSSGAAADYILMHGGGSIDDVWHTGRDLLVQLLQTYRDKPVIVAPSTFHFSETDFDVLLKPFSQPIYLYCREPHSYQRLSQMNLPSNVTVQVAHDTAFLLEGTAYLHELKKQCSQENTLLAMRTNRESNIVSFELHPHRHTPFEWFKSQYSNWEIRRFLKNTIPEVYARKDTVIADPSYEDYDRFLERIVTAREIYTDRLHVGILGAMLGKPVHVFPTRYDKVQGVYAQTLHQYKNVTPHFSVSM